MKFGLVPTGEASGALLVHSQMIPSGRLKKGHLLTEEDCEALLTTGYDSIVVARADSDDMLENDAASRIAKGLVTPSLAAADAFTGRVNLHSRCNGLFAADKVLVDAINAVHPGITLATLADDTPVRNGRMVATVKIIPFGVPKSAVDAVTDLIAAERPADIHPYRPHNVALIQTCLPTLKDSVLDKTERVLGERLDATASRLTERQRCRHDHKALAEKLNMVVDQCDLIVVFGASAIADIEDTIPRAIAVAGGKVFHFGMPVDPGNLLLVGELHGKPVIGAPGCARSAAENGFDWVLRRLVAGRPVDQTYICGLGVGGLLMEIHSRPQPREAVDET